MRTIWKFPLDLREPNEIRDGTPVYNLTVTAHSELLDFQMQNGVPTVWVDFYTENPEWITPVAIVGTGQELPHWADTWEGTVQDGEFVWHLYKVDSYAYDKDR